MQNVQNFRFHDLDIHGEVYPWKVELALLKKKVCTFCCCLYTDRLWELYRSLRQSIGPSSSSAPNANPRSLIALWQCNLLHYCNATLQRGILLFFIGARKMADFNEQENRIFHFSLCAKPDSRKSLLAEWTPLLLVLWLTWIMGGRICSKNVYWGEEGLEEKTLQEIARWKGISIAIGIFYLLRLKVTLTMMRNWWHGTYLIQFVRLCHRVRALSSRPIVAVRIDWNRIWEEFKIRCLASISLRGGQLVKLRVGKKCSTFPAILQWYNSSPLNSCPWNPDGN